MTALGPGAVISFDADLLIWGYSLWGDCTDPGALTAEHGDHYWPSGALWDHKGERSGSLNGEPLPLRFSLPYLVDHLIKSRVGP